MKSIRQVCYNSISFSSNWGDHDVADTEKKERNDHEIAKPADYMLRCAIRVRRGEKIKGDDGKDWFREETVGLDLSQCDFYEANLSGSFSGTYRLCVPIRQEAGAAFIAWCKQHHGQHVGIMLGGKLVRVEKIKGKPTYLLELATYDSIDEALRDRDMIRRGGNEQ